ncbi:endolysin [Arthrobacter phage EastWest]|uniref:Endolysin n=1 Tax=Arthrobacter phage EastWest TaxID=2894292 RepID=A0AAE9C9L2_9CAUD|nr:endolysin [Arthrobacter phage EastWest]
MSQTSDYYAERVAFDFVGDHEGSFVTTHESYYGPQSTQIVEAYVTQLAGMRWHWREKHAKDLLDVGRPLAWFREITDIAELRLGDIVALHGHDTSEFGTVGIFFGQDDKEFVQVFTQNPFKSKLAVFSKKSFVAALRYRLEGTLAQALRTDSSVETWLAKRGQALDLRTPEQRQIDEQAARECVKAYDNYADSVFGPALKRARLADWMPDDSVKVGDEYVAANGKTLRCVNVTSSDEEIRPGDIAVFESDPANPYGHVEVVPPRKHWLKRFWHWLLTA